MSPVGLRLEINKIFGVKKAGDIGAVVGTASLADDLGDLGKRRQDDASLVHDAQALRRASAGSESAPDPDSAFVKVGQELGTDDSAESEEECEKQRAACSADCDPAMLDRPAGCVAITISEPLHHGVSPLRSAF